jgi:hypothetical protein
MFMGALVLTTIKKKYDFISTSYCKDWTPSLEEQNKHERQNIVNWRVGSEQYYDTEQIFLCVII